VSFAITNRHALAAGSSLFALCMGAQGALAQTGPSTEPEPGRDVVVIVGQTIEETLPQELARYGSVVETMTSEEIREGGYTDVSNALQMEVPGLFVAPRGGPFSYLDISLQGSRTQDILFLVDGVRINNRLYPGTITDTLPSSMVERVEVVKGGQGLFYGTNAAAGVINVVTRGYTDEFDGLVSAGVDSLEGYHVDGFMRGKLGPGNIVVYASQDRGPGFEMFDNIQPSSTNRERGYDVRTIGAKYRLELSDTFSIDARYQHNDADLEYLRYNRSFRGSNNRDEEIASLGIDWQAAPDVEVLVKGYWHDWNTRYTDILNSVLPPYTQTVSSDNLFWGYEDKGVNALVKWTPGGPFEYLAGYDYQTYTALDQVWNIEQTEEDVQAFFAQIRSTDELITNGTFAAGVRHNDTGGATSTVWNVSGRYDFTPWLYTQGTIGTSFLLPTAEQLFLVEVGEYLGNPDVEPEESTSINASLGGEFNVGPTIAWSATYFHRDIDNLIDGCDFDPLDTQACEVDRTQAFRGISPASLIADYAGVFYNVPGEVQVRGFELFGVADFGNGFSAVASYTNSKSEAEGSNTQIARIPEAFAKIGGQFDGDTWGMQANVLWTGEQSSVAGAFGRINYGDYVVIDLAGHMYLDAEKNHKLGIRLENALDEEYATRVAAGVVDGGGPILVSNVGAPQTLRLTYSYDF
jgi:outer membrane cobalamin receptor